MDEKQLVANNDLDRSNNRQRMQHKSINKFYATPAVKNTF